VGSQKRKHQEQEAREVLDEKVEGEEEEAEEEKKSAPGEAAARKLCDGVKEACRDDAETRFAAAFIERADWNVAGEIAAQGGKFIVHPERKFAAVTPEEESAENKDNVTETS
jgi:hypothetical protein